MGSIRRALALVPGLLGIPGRRRAPASHIDSLLFLLPLEETIIDHNGLVDIVGEAEFFPVLLDKFVLYLRLKSLVESVLKSVVILVHARGFLLEAGGVGCGGGGLNQPVDTFLGSPFRVGLPVHLLDLFLEFYDAKVEHISGGLVALILRIVPVVLHDRGHPSSSVTCHEAEGEADLSLGILDAILLETDPYLSKP